MDATLKGGRPLLQDLIDLTVDNLCDDKSSLSSVSLVSHSWLTPARRHLFQKISVQGVSEDWGFVPFKDFLLSQQGVSPFVHHLSLTGKHTGGCIVYVPNLDAFLLRCIISRLPRLKSLELRTLQWRSQDCDEQDDSFHSFSPIHLHDLHLTGIEIEGTFDGHLGGRNFLDLIRLFSTIDTLRPCCVYVRRKSYYASIANDPAYQELETPLHFQVASLLYTSPLDFYILDIIRRSNSPATLKDANLQWGDWEGITAVGALLRDIGQSIRDLSLLADHGFWQSRGFRDHEYQWDPECTSSKPSIRSYPSVY